MYWFCHISTCIRHGYTRVPHPEPSSLLPPHTIPLGHPSTPAPSIQYRALNLDWQLASYMIFYMFQCHSPKSSHPLPLPQSPQDCSLVIFDQYFYSGHWKNAKLSVSLTNKFGFQKFSELLVSTKSGLRKPFLCPLSFLYT